MPANMGFPSPPPVKQPSIYDKLMQGLLGGGQSYGGSLTPEDLKAQQQQAMMAMGANLLAGSGPSPTRQSFGSILGPSLLAAQQAKQQTGEDQLKALLLQSQIQKNKQAQQKRKLTTVGAGGAVLDENGSVVYTNPAKVNDGPSNVQEWEYYNKLAPEDQKRFLEMKRNQNALQLVDVAGGKSVFNKASGAIDSVTTAQQEAAGAGTIAQATASSKALGEAEGGQAAKAPAAASMDYVLKQFEGVLPNAMQGGIGGVVGRAGSVLDYKNAQHFDTLKQQLSTELRTVYRIPGEGTLSDQEQAQYGLQLPDRKNHPDVNKAILKDLRERTRLRLETPVGGGAAPAGAVVRKRYNPATRKIE